MPATKTSRASAIDDELNHLEYNIAATPTPSSSTMLVALIAAVQWMTISPSAAHHRRADCYAIITAVVSDSTPARVRRVVTSGIVRSIAVPVANGCVVDRAAADETKRVLVRQMTSEKRRIEWIEIAGADSLALTDHLNRLRKTMRESDIELVHPR